MKKRILLLSLIFLPLNVKALSGSVNISCNKTNLNIGETTTCNISGYSDDEVSGLSLSVSGLNIEISNINKNPAWEGTPESKLDLYTDSNKKGTFGIATFSLKAKDSGTINIDSILFVDKDFNEVFIPSKSLNISINKQDVNDIIKEEPKKDEELKKEELKKDTSLKSLTISNVNINFKSNVYSYNATVPYETQNIKINATANDSNSKVTIPDNTELKVGNNKLIIKVTNDDKKSEYILNVTRKEKELSKNSNIKNIIVKGYDLKFDSKTTSYELGNVNTDKLDLEIELEDSKSTYKIYGNNKIGTNDLILIKVTSESGETKEYIIYVNNMKKEEIKTVVKENYRVSIILSFILIVSLLVNLKINIKLKNR